MLIWITTFCGPIVATPTVHEMVFNSVLLLKQRPFWFIEDQTLTFLTVDSGPGSQPQIGLDSIYLLHCCQLLPCSQTFSNLFQFLGKFKYFYQHTKACIFDPQPYSPASFLPTLPLSVREQEKQIFYSQILFLQSNTITYGFSEIIMLFHTCQISETLYLLPGVPSPSPFLAG